MDTKIPEIIENIDNTEYIDFLGIFAEEHKPQKMSEIFEKVSNNPETNKYQRDCREMIVPDNIDDIQPGHYCILDVSGGGYTNWYYYRTLDGRHMLIFESFNYNSKTYMAREIPCVPTNDFPRQSYYGHEYADVPLVEHVMNNKSLDNTEENNK